MRPYLNDLILFPGLFFLVFVIWLLTPGQRAIDIQLHDTYFVIDRTSMIILILGPLTFFIFLARALTGKFRSIAANVGLIIGLILIAFITYRIIELLESYLKEVKRLNEGLQDSGQLIVSMKNKLYLTWGLFSLWIVAVVLLAIRTIKRWSEGHNSGRGG